MSLRTLSCCLCLMLVACSSPDKAWELAEREDTNQGYLEYLAKYPDGEYADQARARIRELKELRAWERAQFRDRIDNYRRFLGDYPASEYAPAASRRIVELERDAAWAAARAANDAVALQGFLASYPDAPQSWEAEQMLAALAPVLPETPPPPKGDFRVQVGAFRTAAAADTEVRRLDREFTAANIDPIRIVTPAETGGRFFLLQSRPLTGTEARAACEFLTAAGHPCLVINR